MYREIVETRESSHVTPMPIPPWHTWHNQCINKDVLSKLQPALATDS